MYDRHPLYLSIDSLLSSYGLEQPSAWDTVLSRRRPPVCMPPLGSVRTQGVSRRPFGGGRFTASGESTSIANTSLTWCYSRPSPYLLFLPHR